MNTLARFEMERICKENATLRTQRDDLATALGNLGVEATTLRTQLAAAQSDAAALRKGLEDAKAFIQAELAVWVRSYSPNPSESEIDEIVHAQGLLDAIDALLAPASPKGAAPGQASNDRWQPIETAPYATDVLAWLYLPKNPPASGIVIARRCYVEKDEPVEYGAYQMTVGCWWANGRYYSAGHVTKWQPLPEPPTAAETPDAQGEG